MLLSMASMLLSMGIDAFVDGHQYFCRWPSHDFVDGHHTDFADQHRMEAAMARQARALALLISVPMPHAFLLRFRSSDGSKDEE